MFELKFVIIIKLICQREVINDNSEPFPINLYIIHNEIQIKVQNKNL